MLSDCVVKIDETQMDITNIINLIIVITVFYWQTAAVVTRSNQIKSNRIICYLRPSFMHISRKPKLGCVKDCWGSFPSLAFPPSVPSPSLPLSYLPSFLLPYPPLPPLRSRTPKSQLESLGERCKLPQRGLGQSPNRNRILWIYP